MSCCQHSYISVDSDENCVINTVGMTEVNDNMNKFERFINEIINFDKKLLSLVKHFDNILMKS